MAAKRVGQYEHTGATRPNNPPVGLVTPGTDPLPQERKTYAYDTHLDPQLGWAGKAERTSFEVPYLYRGAHRKCCPDFYIRFVSGKTIILEVKGQDDEEQQTKRRYLDEWVRAVNTHGGFGVWGWAVLLDPTNLQPILEEAAQEEAPSSTGSAVLT